MRPPGSPSSGSPSAAPYARRRASPWTPCGPYGGLRGTPDRALADDATVLYYEVDEVESDTPSARRRRLFGRKEPAPVTVVFSHGYCLNQDSWHFQRAALRGLVRAVYWDQRSHGRSGLGVSQGGAGAVPVSIDQLGRDLKAVLDAAAPEGRSSSSGTRWAA